MKKSTFVICIAAVLAVCAFGASAHADTVVVACKSEFQLALVDPETEKVLVKLPTGRGPHEVAVSPDGRTAYVSNFGRYSVYPAGDTDHDKASNTITVIDLVNRKVKATFDLGTHAGPHGMIVSHDGKLLLVTTETPQAVLELDSTTGKIFHAWDTNQERSHMIVTTPDESKFYVTNTVSGSVSVIKRTSGEVKVLPTGPGTEGIAISPDGKEVWAASRADAKISIISTATDAIVATLSSGGKSPKRLDFTPEVAPFDIYRALRTVNPSPYMYYLRMGESHVLGSSATQRTDFIRLLSDGRAALSGSVRASASNCRR